MRRSVLLAAALMTLTLAGCELLGGSAPSPTPPPPEYRPDVVGVVDGRSFVDGSTVRVSLETGQGVVIDQNRAINLFGGTPARGDLLFYGTDRGPWFFTLRPGNGAERCSLNGLATDATGELHFDSGLVLSKAPDFDPGSANFRRPGGSFFCVNEQGQLTRLYE